MSSTGYDHIGLKTVSADHKSHRLYVTMDEMHQLDRDKHIIIRDLSSFAEFRIVDLNLNICFTWLKSSFTNQVHGYTQSVMIRYADFKQFV